MHSDYFLRSCGGRCNFGNGNGRGIAGQNGMGGSKAVEFPENRQFDVFILSSSFNNQIGFFRPFSKGRKSSNVFQSCRSNVFGNYPLTYLSSKILFDSAECLRSEEHTSDLQSRE